MLKLTFFQCLITFLPATLLLFVPTVANPFPNGRVMHGRAASGDSEVMTRQHSENGVTMREVRRV